MTEAALKQLVAEMKAAGKLGPDFGQAMKQVMIEVKGRADGQTVAAIVKANL